MQRNVARHIRHAPPGKYHMVQEPMDIFMVSNSRPSDEIAGWLSNRSSRCFSPTWFKHLAQ